MPKLIDEIKTAEEIKSENKNRQAQYYKAYKKKNPDYYKNANKKNRANNFETVLLCQYRSYARKKRIAFNLTIDDIVIPENCPLIDKPITRIVGEGKVMMNPCVYMIDETIGYVKGNVLITSILANSMRSVASKEDLIKFALNVLKQHGI